jgi:hypothetical protein
MLDTMEPIPKAVAPLPCIMSSAFFLQRSASSVRLKVSGGRAILIGTPPIVAIDQATNWESPCSPKTYASIELAAT